MGPSHKTPPILGFHLFQFHRSRQIRKSTNPWVCFCPLRPSSTLLAHILFELNFTPRKWSQCKHLASAPLLFLLSVIDTRKRSCRETSPHPNRWGSLRRSAPLTSYIPHSRFLSSKLSAAAPNFSKSKTTLRQLFLCVWANQITACGRFTLLQPLPAHTSLLLSIGEGG
jgi:hypothetical protein